MRPKTSRLPSATLARGDEKVTRMEETSGRTTERGTKACSLLVAVPAPLIPESMRVTEAASEVSSGESQAVLELVELTQNSVAAQAQLV